MHGSIQPETPRRASSPVGPDNTPALRDSNTPPARIPDHELICQIGHGAYGEVWLARNVVGTLRAVKVVYRRTFSEAYPFEREFNGIQKYEPISRSHDGLIDILQIGRNDSAGYFYYVMELADEANSLVAAEVTRLKTPVGMDQSLLTSAATYQPRT